jgi:hypothetical protein
MSHCVTCFSWGATRFTRQTIMTTAYYGRHSLTLSVLGTQGFLHASLQYDKVPTKTVDIDYFPVVPISFTKAGLPCVQWRCECCEL